MQEYSSSGMLFYTQIASIVVFLIALFGVYRTLAAQKDATIEALKEQLELLKLQLREASSQTPDVAVEALSRRVKNISEELARLNADNQANAETIANKEHELSVANKEMVTLKRHIKRAEALLEEYSCPKCKALMISREFAFESVEINGRDIDIDHEHVLYECGLELVDGKEITKCGSL